MMNMESFVLFLVVLVNVCVFSGEQIFALPIATFGATSTENATEIENSQSTMNSLPTLHNASHFALNTIQKVVKTANEKLFPGGFMLTTPYGPSPTIDLLEDTLEEVHSRTQTKADNSILNKRKVARDVTKYRLVMKPRTEFQNTRFAIGPTTVRIIVNSHPIVNYYPPHRPRSSVCRHRSTVFGDVQVIYYLGTHWYRRSFRSRPVFMSLRKDVFKRGNSEECHSFLNKDWKLFQECSLRRNQRMESKIPQYPLHQAIFDRLEDYQ